MHTPKHTHESDPETLVPNWDNSNDFISNTINARAYAHFKELIC